MKKINIILFFLFLIPVFSKAQEVFEIKWGSGSPGSNQYKTAVIIYEDGTGKARTKWQSEGSADANFVETDLVVKTSEQGMYLLASNPVYPGTEITHPSYLPDNFIIFQENGKLWGVQLDEGENFAKCSSVRQITGSDDRKNMFLREFDEWSLY